MESNKRIAGKITDNPVSKGTQLKFQPIPISFDIALGLNWITNWDFFNGILLHISFTDKETHSVLGSAVLVASLTALSATHVIEPYLKSIMNGDMFCTCFGITSEGMQAWRVKKISMVPGTDLMILGLEIASELPENNLFYQSVITTRLPKIGESLLLTGFRAGENMFPVNDPPGAEWSGNVFVSKGIVTQHYLEGRDKSMIPFAVLEVSTAALGGMSGGPVYDENGLLVGLVCSSLETSPGEGVSYVSLLWQAITIRFEPSFTITGLKSPTSLLEMNKVGLCAIDRPEVIEAIYEDDGTIHTNYKIWG